MAAPSKLLVWIDLEMTGLEPENCYIMEIGSLVTGPELEVVAEGPNLIIHNSAEQLETLRSLGYIQ